MHLGDTVDDWLASSLPHSAEVMCSIPTMTFLCALPNSTPVSECLHFLILWSCDHHFLLPIEQASLFDPQEIVCQLWLR